MLRAEEIVGGTRRRIAGLAALKCAIGSELGTSGWVTVTQPMIDDFADATGDHQWIHVNPERAADGPFGTTVGHGYLTLSILPALVRTAYVIDGIAMGVNYGSDSVRFPSPVPVGSRIRAVVALVDLSPRGSGMLARTRVSVEVDGSERPACVAEILSLLVP